MRKALYLVVLASVISGCLTEVVAPDVGSRSGDSNPVPSSDGSSAQVGGEATYGSVTLSWTAPTFNTDGSVLTDLDGYRIYWGTTPGQYPNSVTIDNVSINVYVLENIPSGTYEFVATSFNSAGIESNYSNPVIRVIF